MIISEDGAYDPGLPSIFSSLHYVAPGYGCWIKMKEAAALVYPLVNPFATSGKIYRASR